MGYGMPGPAPARSSLVWVAIVVPLVLILVGAGLWAYVASNSHHSPTRSAVGTTTSATAATTTTTDSSSNTQYQVGDCLKVWGTANDSHWVAADCGTIDANYKVAFKTDGPAGQCPQGEYTTVTQIGSDAYQLCLEMNVQQGDCVQQNDSNSVKVPCGSPSESFRVTGILTGTTDDAGCSQDTTKYRSYTQPTPMVVCLAPPN